MKLCSIILPTLLFQKPKNLSENRLIPLLFQNRFIIGYLKIIAQLIFVVDLQINQCKVSINLLAVSLLTKVQSQLKVRTFRLSTINSTKVQSESNFTMPNHVYSLIFSPNKKLN